MKDKYYEQLVKEHVLTDRITQRVNIRDNLNVHIKDEFSDLVGKNVKGINWESVYIQLRQKRLECEDMLKNRLETLLNEDNVYLKKVVENPGVEQVINRTGLKEAFLNPYGKNVCGVDAVVRDTWEEIYEEDIKKVDEDFKYKEKVEDLGLGEIVDEGDGKVSLKAFIKADTYNDMYNKLITIMEEE